MEELQLKVVTELVEHNIDCQIETIQENQVSLLVHRRHLKTVLSIIRPSHRDFEVDVEVDYTKAYTKPYFRTHKPQSQKISIFSLDWLILILLGGALVVGIISSAVATISSILNETVGGISQITLALITLTLIVLLILLWLLGVPFVRTKRKQLLDSFNEEVLSLCIQVLNDIETHLSSVDILRCWSCFKEIEVNQDTCPFCNEKQK